MNQLNRLSSYIKKENGSGKGTSLNLLGIAGNVIATAREEEGVESYYYYQKDLTGSVTNLRSADGAIAGPRVAKVAKQAVSYVKKLPSVQKKMQSMKSTMQKVSNGAKKITSKTKQVISNHGKPKQINSTAGNPKQEVVNIQLRYKDGWTAAQRAEADAKIKTLNEAYTVKTKVERGGTSPSRMFKRVFGKESVPKGYDMDHVIDLQLGGIDDIINMKPLDRSVNRSLGAQIMNAIKPYEYGTVFGTFTII